MIFLGEGNETAVDKGQATTYASEEDLLHLKSEMVPSADSSSVPPGNYFYFIKD